MRIDIEEIDNGFIVRTAASPSERDPLAQRSIPTAYYKGSAEEVGNHVAALVANSVPR